ncbi:prephenate dehydrogenase/arogenate dehydrogenase family protein [Natronomonas sp. EA1]|uniref:prephenate dehydrogenase/arogenate dehydrogenase family protein n=1 Tax=Natronomonas sp. EA1 TaxID=3421655 RepID=UPI003EBBA744
MNVLVVGAGSMGRWFAETIDADVAFADRDPSVADAAAADVGGRAVPLDTDERFELVCLAVPMRVVADAIATHAPRATDAIVDVTGVMAAPVEAMREHAPELERLSTHPLFARGNAPGNVAIVPDSRGPVTDAVRESLAAAGNTAFETTVAEHDDAMSTVQARAHAAVLAYALAAEEVREEFHTPLSAPLQRLVEQVSGNTPRVYSEIQEQFPGAADVADAARRIAEADAAEFERLYEEL